MRSQTLLVVALVSGLLAPAASARRPSSPARTRYARIQRVCPPPRGGEATCAALVRTPVPASTAAEPGVVPYTVGDGAASSGPAGGLTPSQLAGAYGYEPAASGSGQTVAIVDAFDDPAIEEDLATFDEHYGLAPCTRGNGCFTKVSEGGSDFSLPEADTSGWSVEISLDVETVHSACPHCRILLVEADSSRFTDLAAAENTAARLGATEISNSYGGSEGPSSMPEREAYNHPGVVIAAATGDFGWDNWAVIHEGKIAPGAPNVPASLPSVVAVGGTTLELDASGAREAERVWNGNGALASNPLAEGASGGGCSTLYPAQPWQQQTPGYAATGCAGNRVAADISAVADPVTGFDIFDSYDCGPACEAFKRGADWLTIGGTSLATPLISSLYALAGGSGGVGYPALTLYGHLGDGSLFDVTEGGNGWCDDHGLACGIDELGPTLDCEGTTACNAAAGFDGPSGLGTPNGLGAFTPRLPSASIAAPGALTSGVAAGFSVGAASDPYPGGSIAGYTWNWGDGTPDSSGAAAAHTFAAPGSYTVTLTATDNYGLSASVTAPVAVLAPPVGLASQGIAAEQTRAPAHAPHARLAGATLQASASGAVPMQITCPVGGSACAGTLTLHTLGAVAAGHGAAATLTLASRAYSVSAGKTRTIIVHLSRRALALLIKRGHLRVRVTIRVGTGAGPSYTAQRVVTLRAARRSSRGR